MIQEKKVKSLGHKNSLDRPVSVTTFFCFVLCIVCSVWVSHQSINHHHVLHKRDANFCSSVGLKREEWQTCSWWWCISWNGECEWVCAHFQHHFIITSSAFGRGGDDGHRPFWCAHICRRRRRQNECSRMSLYTPLSFFYCCCRRALPFFLLPPSWSAAHFVPAYLEIKGRPPPVDLGIWDWGERGRDGQARRHWRTTALTTHLREWFFETSICGFFVWGALNQN